MIEMAFLFFINIFILNPGFLTTSGLWERDSVIAVSNYKWNIFPMYDPLIMYVPMYPHPTPLTAPNPIIPVTTPER